MKNIVILILFLFLSIGSVNVFGQANTGKIGSPNTTTIVQGGFQADSALRIPFLPKNYNYTKGQTTFRQLILATEDTTLYINKGSAQFQVFDQSDTNTAYGPTTPYYVNKEINKIINDSTLNVKVVGFGLDRMDSILLVDSTKVLTVNKAAQVYVKYPDTVLSAIIPSAFQVDSAKRNIRAGAVKYTDTLNSVTIPSSYQVDSAKRNIRNTIASNTVGAVTSAQNGQMLYKSGDTLRGASVSVDTIDKRLLFPANTSTVTVTTPYNGGVKFYNVNSLGISEMIVSDTVAIPSALQRALSYQVYGQVVPSNSASISSFGHLAYAGMVVASGPVTASFATSSQSTTSQQVGYPRLVLATLALTNGTVTVRCGQTVNSGGIFGGSSKFSSGSGRGTFIFSLPTYLSTQRLFVGYTGVTAAISGDPTGGGQNNIPLFGIGKDAADTTLQFIMNDNSGTPTKVNTGVVPNTNDVYRVTCYVSPDNRYYIRLQVSSKTAAPAVYVHVPTSKIPPVGTKLVFQQTANNGTVGGVISIALIQIMEELY